MHSKIERPGPSNDRTEATNGFPKTSRVVRGDDFTVTMRRGGCAADGTLVVFATPRTDRDHPNVMSSRMGVTIPKKTGNAVVRNRWKRLIREAFRTQREQLPAGYDFIVRPKKDATPDWKRIQRGLPRLAAKAVARIK